MSGLPPVAPRAAAAALDALPARLRKRLDGAAAAMAGRPVERDGPRLRVAVDEENAVVLTLTGGVVAEAGDVVCSCLLAPNCLHRAAVLAAAPVADEVDGEGDGGGDDGEADPGGGTADPGGGSADPGHGTAAGPGGGLPAAAGTGGPDGPAPDGPAAEGAPDADAAVDAAVLAAAREVWEAGAEVLAAGVAGAGAVRRTALLRAGHGARLAGLAGLAALATRVARRLSEAAAHDPAFRLADLTAALAALLDAALRLSEAGGGGRVPAAVLAAARGGRRAYREAGTLKLHGLLSEPVVTASGYAGVVTHAVTDDGRLRTVSDVAAGGPERVARAAASSVPGGAALSLRELGAGAVLLADGARVSADGRVGGGSGVRTVRLGGRGWDGGPAAALWRRPAAEQVREALAGEPAGPVFLHGELTVLDGGPALRVTGGPVVRLVAADDRPELPYVANLRLLARCPGLAVRVVARPDRDRPATVAPLAVAWEDEEGSAVRVDLGLRALTRAALPGVPGGAPEPAAGPGGLPYGPALLRRAVTRCVEGGRAVAAAAADPAGPARLLRAGMPYGAACLSALDAAASHRHQDPLGRLLPGTPAAFARAWLAAALYAESATLALLAAEWEAGEPAAP